MKFTEVKFTGFVLESWKAPPKRHGRGIRPDAARLNSGQLEAMSRTFEQQLDGEFRRLASTTDRESATTCLGRRALGKKLPFGFKRGDGEKQFAI